MNEEANILMQIRAWLIAGATIKATDRNEPVLQKVGGKWIGGMTVSYPSLHEIHQIENLT